MEWVETTGRSVKEAKDAALEQLGIAASDAEFEVVAEAKKGLLGRVKEEARVRARVKPAVPRPKDGRRDRRRREQGRSVVDRPKRRRPSGNGQNEGTAQRPAPERQEMDQASMEDQRDEAARFVSGLVSTLGLRADVRVEDQDEDTILASVEGQDLGLLIGPKGQTLAAIQELARTVVQRKVPGQHARLMVDVAGYREKRREALERFTEQVAREVQASGITRALEPMPPPDRKVVHDTVNRIEGLKTISEGEEPRRRVLIAPEQSQP